MRLSCALSSLVVCWLGAPLLARTQAFPDASGAHVEGAWERVASEGLVLAAPLTLVESSASTLRAEGDRVIRSSQGGHVELSCLDPDGTGEIRGFARDPAGLVFIAAERGVFVTSPDVDTLDRLRLGPGAPRGAPTSVIVDARRRVWIGTDTEIGVIDPSFFWGRTLGEADGLPPGGHYRLRSDALPSLAPGAFVVECTQGVYVYRPDRGPKPAVTSVTIDGEPWQSDVVTARTYGDEIRIEAEGRAAGGATFRFRIDGHHVWRELSPDRPIERIPPGAHTIDVIAIDRDLNRSIPARVRVKLAYPFYYAKSFVVPCVLVTGTLVSAFFLARARRLRAPWTRGLLSAGLAFVFGVQILAGLVPHAKGWPFIGFSMYTNTYREGSIIYDGVLTGIEPWGGTRRLDFNALGHLADDRWQVLHPIIDGGDPVAREWVEAFNARYPNVPLAGLQARADRRRLTPDGAVRIAPLILSSYFHEATDGQR